MFNFITHRPLWVNVLVFIIVLSLLVLLFLGSLDRITKHNQTQKVPLVVGQNIDAARKTLEDKGFEVEVQDSIYIDSMPKLSVLKQTPEAEADVKVNRTIYLTVNRAQPPLVEMPNLVGFSIRNAQMYLENLGLHLGDTTYRPDIAKNAVLEQLYNEQPIKAGTKIFMGSTISFILGNGIGTQGMAVPMLVGRQYAQAKSMLNDLNISFTSVFDPDVVDTPHAYVTRQNPERYAPSTDGSRHYNEIKAGQNIDIYLSVKPLSTGIDTTEAEPADITPQ